MRMKVLVEIKTPQGSAYSTSKRIAGHILPWGVKHKTWVSDTDDIIYWEVEGSVSKCLKVNRNVAYYDRIMKSALESKAVQWKMKSMSAEDSEMLRLMLLEQTKVRIVKMTEQDEVDSSNRSWWDRVKDKLNII